MPAWTDKDERQYEHIKDSSMERGKPERRAEEIAARTVNKTRRREGRTPRKSSQGTGNPNNSLEDRSKRELDNLARKLKIEGRSKLNKSGLIAAIRRQRD